VPRQDNHCLRFATWHYLSRLLHAGAAWLTGIALLVWADCLNLEVFNKSIRCGW